jgi:hypothetical protein
MKTLDWRNATPDQLISWQIASGLLAFNTITPLNVQVTIAGSEFLTYNAAKYYFCLDATFSHSTGAVGTAAGSVSIYNQLDVLKSIFSNNYPAWDTTGAAMNYVKGIFSLKNFHFSRIVTAQYVYIHFNGYKLTIV